MPWLWYKVRSTAQLALYDKRAEDQFVVVNLRIVAEMSPLYEPKNMHRMQVDEASRLKLQDALRSAAEAMETPNDTMLRLFNGVSASFGMFWNRDVCIG